eukprot:TRINITY_DN5803_c0_g1_i1.p1 TRINITY_DN5803_c0_g1~~TRINITY_DN5803_c0_g1_i1.p1  ORF type:complete len:174 (-),score=28.19 TRINITY_DN5803_c0_g1_i1:160-681(-)
MPSREDIKSIQQKFMNWDTDGSGKIGKPEFRRILRECGVPIQNCDMLFDLADANDDDEVDWNEFVNWLFGNMQVRGRDTVNSRAIRSIASHATYKPTGVARQEKSPMEILKKRFPDKSEGEIKMALEMAEGHGGKAAAHLAGEIRLHPPASRISCLGAELGGGASQLRALYGM